jgi:serine O-acetyltransferase
MFETIRADIDRKIRAYGVRPQDQTFFRKRITPLLELGTLAVVVFRFGRWAYSLKLPVLRQLMIAIYLVVNQLCLMMSGAHLQVESDIGPGLIVHNAVGVLILVKRMGHSCTLTQDVSIGTIRGEVRPTIGNNVFFGAGSKVFGPVTIGDNVVVCPNSFVAGDVPSNCTVMGVPARIISREPVSPYLKSPIIPT